MGLSIERREVLQVVMAALARRLRRFRCQHSFGLEPCSCGFEKNKPGWFGKRTTAGLASPLGMRLQLFFLSPTHVLFLAGNEATYRPMSRGNFGNNCRL